jgi:hypothetical protein
VRDDPGIITEGEMGAAIRTRLGRGVRCMLHNPMLSEPSDHIVCARFPRDSDTSPKVLLLAEPSRACERGLSVRQGGLDYGMFRISDLSSFHPRRVLAYAPRLLPLSLAVSLHHFIFEPRPPIPFFGYFTLALFWVSSSQTCFALRTGPGSRFSLPA